MSIQRFVAPNGREALAQVRRELGADALVLLTRKLTGGRVEVLAVAQDAMDALIEDRGTEVPLERSRSSPATAGVTESVNPEADSRAPTDTSRAETFEQFLRRQARRQAQPQRTARPGAAHRDEEEEADPATDHSLPAAVRPLSPATSGAMTAAAVTSPSVFRYRTDAPGGVADAMPAGLTPGSAPSTVAVVESTAATSAAGAPAAATDARLLAEIQSMRALLLEQMATMGTANSAAELHRRSPMQVRAMTRLLTAGFSPDVARHIAEHAPAAATPGDSDQWLADVLSLNLRCVSADSDWLGLGGVYALVGPTGVGKTTTVAKLAARFAVRYGAQTLGLITLDAFRVGAHEQLRAYGRILGTPVHLAQDAATLADLLASMAGRRLVLIDTCGVSQRDQRLEEMLGLLEQATSGQRSIQRLLLLNAASHAETLDDVARAWRARQCVGALLTKLDEAVRMGGALDCLLRHKLAVHGATNGQRVPEDWVVADARELAQAALRPGQAAFTLAEAEGAVLAANARHSSLAAAD